MADRLHLNPDAGALPAELRRMLIIEALKYLLTRSLNGASGTVTSLLSIYTKATRATDEITDFYETYDEGVTYAEAPGYMNLHARQMYPVDALRLLGELKDYLELTGIVNDSERQYIVGLLILEYQHLMSMMQFVG